MTPAVFEGKYELDSLASFLKLSYWYSRYAQGGAARFSAKVDMPAWSKAVERALDVIAVMQRVSGQEGESESPYLFQRETSVSTDTLSMQGRGPPGNPSLGLSRQLFRPSDDAVTLPYTLPGNAFACAELAHLLELLELLGALGRGEDDALKGRAAAVKTQICSALRGLFSRAEAEAEAGAGAGTGAGAGAAVIPYEVDGYGGKVFMDDANVPSLLSLPLLGALAASDPAYRATRQFVWSARNPYFYSGSAGEGVGGPHVGPGMAWPMSLAVRALTSSDEEEIASCLSMLLRSTAGTGLIHESFDVDDLSSYTRPWFAWANGLFAELVLQLVVAHPSLVLKGDAEAVNKAQAAVRVPVSLQVQRDQPVL